MAMGAGRGLLELLIGELTAVTFDLGAVAEVRATIGRTAFGVATRSVDAASLFTTRASGAREEAPAKAGCATIEAESAERLKHIQIKLLGALKPKTSKNLVARPLFVPFWAM